MKGCFGMKLASYLFDSRVSCGIVTPQGLIDIPSAIPDPAQRLHSIREILIKLPHSMTLLRTILDTDPTCLDSRTIQWLAPIPRPGKILALAGNYKEHVAETDGQNPLPHLQRKQQMPRPFLMPGTCATGHQTTVPWPLYSKDVDYEIELAVFIGKAARAVSPQQARQAIAGYSIANDISARTVTCSRAADSPDKNEFYEWLIGKWADGFCPIGPWIVTADEIPDPQNLALELRVNGETRQQASTADMTHSVDQIVSFLSHLVTLEPGDVICTGTPSGVGAASNNMLRPGDRIDCTIETIGTLSNTLGNPPEVFYHGLQ